jgi:hypothetical protein
MLFGGTAVMATHPCTSPLVLDMDENLPLATNPGNGVDFDINGDGVEERIGWPAGDAFLWLDLNRNGVVDDGTEFFGTSFLLPSGEYAENGFEALAIYDRPELGGNDDGLISPGDLAWAWLRLWVDSNRDGISQRHEISTLPETGVVWIGLEYGAGDFIDGGGNLHAFQGIFGRRHREFGAWRVREHPMDDIFFAWMPTAE